MTGLGAVGDEWVRRLRAKACGALLRLHGRRPRLHRARRPSPLGHCLTQLDSHGNQPGLFKLVPKLFAKHLYANPAVGRVQEDSCKASDDGGRANASLQLTRVVACEEVLGCGIESRRRENGIYRPLSQAYAGPAEYLCCLLSGLVTRRF